MVDLFSQTYKSLIHSEKSPHKFSDLEETKLGTDPERPHKHKYQFLEVLVNICTRYNPKYLIEISRSTWTILVQYFLKARSNTFFQMRFYKLVTAGFELNDEPLILSIMLFENLIGELWEILQEKERYSTLPVSARPSKDLFYNISLKMIMLLETLEGNPKFPIMNGQFTVNLAWKKIKEVRNRDKPIEVLEAIQEKITAVINMSRPPSKSKKHSRAGSSAYAIATKRSTTAESNAGLASRRSSKDSQKLSSGRNSSRISGKKP